MRNTDYELRITNYELRITTNSNRTTSHFGTHILSDVHRSSKKVEKQFYKLQGGSILLGLLHVHYTIVIKKDYPQKQGKC
jgi:hypothetical protein